MPKKQFLFLIVLGILVVLSWVWGLTAKPIRSRAGKSSTLSSEPLWVASSNRALLSRTAHGGKATPSFPASKEQTGKIDEGLTADPSEWGENPFLMERRTTSTDSGEESPQGLVLGGVLWDPQTPSAVVNNRVVSVGDYVGVWQVTEIHRDRAVLSDGAKTHVLTVE